jgi:sec-independent protein translocase protein TatC
MASTLRPIRPEDRLSLVEHLDELRKRLIICIVIFAASFGLCLWQGDVVLNIMNHPLQGTAFKKSKGKDPFERTASFQVQLRKTAIASAKTFDQLASAADDAATRRGYQALATENRVLAKSVPPAEARRPVTLGVSEPFTATVKIAGAAALLLALPLLLYQAYAFVLPAFSREERSVAVPLMAMVPFLFIAGVVFAYYMVLPNAISFLQNFNDDKFDILIQAKDYYRFAITVLIAMGLCFQVPVGILACARLGIISVAQLRGSRRYSILGIAVIAMLLPGQDPVTMLSLMVPLYVLFEGSILLAWLMERRVRRHAPTDLED